jgi:hypothetical protein
MNRATDVVTPLDPEPIRGCLKRETSYLGEASGSDVTTVDDPLARLVDDVTYHNGSLLAEGAALQFPGRSFAGQRRRAGRGRPARRRCLAALRSR